MMKLCCKLVLWLSLAFMTAKAVQANPVWQPSWWTTDPYRIQNAGSSPDENGAPVPSGQLMHVAEQAKAFLTAHPDIAVQAPSGLDSLLSAYRVDFENGNIDSQEAINVGQLKSVASWFYEWMHTAGHDPRHALLASGYPEAWADAQINTTVPFIPWDPAQPTQHPGNDQLANLGQLRLVFSFDPSFSLTGDGDGDGVMDSVEVAMLRTFHNRGVALPEGTLGEQVEGFDPEQDYDQDGLTDREEYDLKSDPTRGDSDGDLMPDSWEVKYGLLVTLADAGDDPDGDEVNNLEEYRYGFHPNQPDSVHEPVDGLDGDTWVYRQLSLGDEPFPGGYDPLENPGSPEPDLTNEISEFNAVRFLSQAAMAFDQEDVDHVRYVGYAKWIEEQFAIGENDHFGIRFSYDESLLKDFSRGLAAGGAIMSLKLQSNSVIDYNYDVNNPAGETLEAHSKNIGDLLTRDANLLRRLTGPALLATFKDEAESVIRSDAVTVLENLEKDLSIRYNLLTETTPDVTTSPYDDQYNPKWPVNRNLKLRFSQALEYVEKWPDSKETAEQLLSEAVAALDHVRNTMVADDSLYRAYETKIAEIRENLTSMSADGSSYVYSLTDIREEMRLLAMMGDGFCEFLDTPRGTAASDRSLLHSIPLLSQFFGQMHASNRGVWTVSGRNQQTVLLRNALEGEGQLRQRVFWFLSKLFSLRMDDFHRWRREAQFNDQLQRNAFASYRKILGDVTYDPLMAIYLTYLGNAGSREGVAPDENYAREIMQLYTIGLSFLNEDGSGVKGADGKEIPTYDSADIAELAKVFTGMWYVEKAWGEPTHPVTGGWLLEFHGDKHDLSAKQLVAHRPGESQIVLGAYSGNSAAEEEGYARNDVEHALDHLVAHPNVGPFIALRMIQSMVTSNPSPEYIARVAKAFRSDSDGIIGLGEKGNMKAAIRAVLLDPEARRNPYRGSFWHSNHKQVGKLQEPLLRITRLAGVLSAGKEFRDFPLAFGPQYPFSDISDSGQRPFVPPNVFSYFSPSDTDDFFEENDLVAPEFSIFTSRTAVTFSNYLWFTLKNGCLRPLSDRPNGTDASRWAGEKILTPPFKLDLSLREWFSGTQYGDLEAEYSDAAGKKHVVGQILDRVNLMLCSGRLSADTRSGVLQGILQSSESISFEEMIKKVLISVAISPDAAAIE